MGYIGLLQLGMLYRTIAWTNGPMQYTDYIGLLHFEPLPHRTTAARTDAAA